MQTLKFNQEVLFIKRPETAQEWATNPIVEFTVPTDTTVSKGDRIFCCRKMITQGPNSGGIIEIYYYIEYITDSRPYMADHKMKTAVTAKVNRLEI